MRPLAFSVFVLSSCAGFSVNTQENTCHSISPQVSGTLVPPSLLHKLTERDRTA